MITVITFVIGGLLLLRGCVFLVGFVAVRNRVGMVFGASAVAMGVGVLVSPADATLGLAVGVGGAVTHFAAGRRLRRGPVG